MRSFSAFQPVCHHRPVSRLFFTHQQKSQENFAISFGKILTKNASAAACVLPCFEGVAMFNRGSALQCQLQSNVSLYTAVHNTRAIHR